MFCNVQTDNEPTSSASYHNDPIINAFFSYCFLLYTWDSKPFMLCIQCCTQWNPGDSGLDIYYNRNNNVNLFYGYIWIGFDEKIKEIRDMDHVTIKPHAGKCSSVSSISCLLGIQGSWLWFTQSSHSLNICLSFRQMHPLPEWWNLTTGNRVIPLWKDPILLYKVSLAAIYF